MTMTRRRHRRYPNQLSDSSAAWGPPCSSEAGEDPDRLLLYRGVRHKGRETSLRRVLVALHGRAITVARELLEFF